MLMEGDLTLGGENTMQYTMYYRILYLKPIEFYEPMSPNTFNLKKK